MIDDIILWVMNFISCTFKIKDKTKCANITFLLFSILGFIADIIAVVIISFCLGEFQIAIVSLIVIGIVRIGSGEHYDTWLECIVLTVILIISIILFKKYINDNLISNIIMAVITALWFRQWKFGKKKREGG